MDKNSGAGGGICLPHDVFNVFFDSLFSYQEGVCDLFVRPAFSQVLDDCLLTVGQLKSLSSMFSVQILFAA